MGQELTKIKLPTLAELTADVELAWKADSFNALLNAPVPEKWVAHHPFIKSEITDANGNKTKVPYKYLPIDKVEYLLRKIFKKFRIEITGQGTAFNGVWVSVRVHYLNPVSGEWGSHDGIGASQLQTAKGTSPADMANINNGAVSMAFPLAKTLAVKDACDHFGNLFGANLNRRDVVPFTPDANLQPVTRERLIEAWENGANRKKLSPDEIIQAERIIHNEEANSYKKLFDALTA